MLDLSPRQRVHVHRALKWAWVGLIVPTLLWWRESILWVAFMSLYANIASHYAAEEAAQGAVEAEDRGTP